MAMAMVPVHNTKLMQMFQRQHNLGNIESGLMFTQCSSSFQHIEEITTSNELHHDIDVAIILACEKHLDNERMRRRQR